MIGARRQKVASLWQASQRICTNPLHSTGLSTFFLSAFRVCTGFGSDIGTGSGSGSESGSTFSSGIGSESGSSSAGTSTSGACPATTPSCTSTYQPQLQVRRNDPAAVSHSRVPFPFPITSQPHLGHTAYSSISLIESLMFTDLFLLHPRPRGHHGGVVPVHDAIVPIFLIRGVAMQ